MSWATYSELWEKLMQNSYLITRIRPTESRKFVKEERERRKEKKSGRDYENTNANTEILVQQIHMHNTHLYCAKNKSL